MTEPVDYASMRGPELVVAYNAMVEKAGLMGLEITQVKKFKDLKIGVERCQKLSERLAKRKDDGTKIEQPPAEVPEKEEEVATGKKTAKKGAAKKGAKKTAAPKTPKVAKPKFGHDVRIVEVAEENPRFKNSKAAKLFDSMKKYMDGHPKATVAELVEATEYRRQDYEWDKERGSIKVSKV